MPVLALILGIFSGILLGLTGGGGSIVTIPIFIYLLHYSYHSATTVSLIVVGSSALIGAYLKRKDIEYLTGGFFVVCGIVLTPLGILGSRYFSPHLLMLSIAVLMVIVGVVMLKGGSGSETDRKNFFKIAIVAGVTGALTGLFGVGGGFLIVPGLILFAGLSPKKAVSTSLFVIFLISLVTLTQKLGSSSIPWGVTLIFLCAMIIGMVVGSLVSKKIKERSVKKIFAIFVLILGVIQIIINII